MKLPNNGRNRVPTGHLLSLNKAFSTRIVLHLVELWAKGVSWKFPNNPGCCQDSGLLPTNRWQGPVAEDNPISLIGIEKLNTGACLQPSSPQHSHTFGTGRYSASHRKRSINTKPSHKPCDLQCFSACKIC